MAVVVLFPLFLFLVFAAKSTAITKSELFPFGTELTLPAVDDVSSQEIPLSVPIIFYGNEYRSIYVNDNGILSFLTEVPAFFNAQFPLTYPIIAPLYSDVDTRGSGRVYYGETQAPDLLERATRDIRSHFSSAGSFHARSLFIATWEEVGHYEKGTDKQNTFQVVLATDGEDSYVYFLYPSGGVQWIQGKGKNPNLPDARAQAGFMSGDGRLFTLRGSGTEQARNFDRMSNARKPGLWLFHIGRPLGLDNNVMPPDLESSQDFSEKIDGRPSTCADTLLPCPPHSLCVDHPEAEGFCCVCKDSYFGNGRNCVEKSSPQRMNGKVSGVINDVPLQDADLHAYIVPEDGRTYTAVSRVPSAIGSDLQLLTPLGGVIGWLFAASRSGAPNGFTVTGATFNRTVELDFPQSGDHVFIEENFLGPDVFNYMRVIVKVRGQLPTIPAGSNIEIPDYVEEYTRVSPGLIRSHASRTYRLNGNNLEVPFTLDQTIMYSECEIPMTNTRLTVARNFIVYDAGEQIVRYAMTNKISHLNVVDDPCKEGRHQCGQNSNCIVEGDSFRCVCLPGYQHIYEGDSSGERASCIDINECAIGRSNCHVNADCINIPGSFACRCQPGYNGDGINCERKRTCFDLSCDPNADCVERIEGPYCQCRPGYVGNGLTCQEGDDDDCSVISYCDHRADCVFVENRKRHECRCRPGYTGDGVVCVEDSCDVADNCSPDGSCLYDAEGEAYYCACKAGFSGDGYVCLPEGQFSSCDVTNNCHPAAQCVYNSQAQRYHCQCNAGYRGDGERCTRTDDVSCDRVNICSNHATCVRDEFSESGRHVCHCKEGYEGDGIICTPIDECNTADNCDTNAECVYDSASQRYHCQCLPGFRGTGRKGTCSPDFDAPCNVRNTCHEHATCAYDSVDLRYRCQCNPGYNGDGYRCEKTAVPCNVINNCHVRAECLYDSNSRGYRCRCLPGYEGDGHNCRVLRSCRDDRYLCDRNADCIPGDGTEEYTCHCKQGFIGDGISCTVAPQHVGGYLVFAHGMSLLRVPTTPTKSNPGQLLLMEPNQTPVGLATDCQEGHLYWADASLKVIRKANYNGSEVTMVISDDMVSPEGVAIDWLGRTIYWTDSGKDTIEVAGLNNAYRKVLISEGLDNPRGVAVHPGLGKMYWTDWNRNAPKIEVANMDGTGRTELVKDNLGLPNMLVIDFGRHTLCWTDAGFGRIECISLNGQSRRLVYTPAAYPFGIAIHEGYIYWTDWDIKFLHRVDINGGEAEPLEIPAGGSGRMYGLVSLPSYCPSVGSPCAIGNGGCRYLCLPDGRGGRSCICPDTDGEYEVECNEILS